MGEKYPKRIAAVAVGSAVRSVDVLLIEGTPWLVPVWGDMPAEGVTVPMRLVCLATLPHTVQNQGLHDYVLKEPLPIEIFDFSAPIEGKWGLIVVEPARLRIPKDRSAN